MKKLIALFFCLFAANANANLITNGDFSTLDTTGWTQSGGDYWDASYGYLSVYDNSGWAILSQEISTIAGSQYDLSFDTMAYQISGNDFAWSIDSGATLNYITTTTSWVTIEAMFTATSGSTNVAFYIATEWGTGTWRLDNISVTEGISADISVPAPPSLALLGLGLAGLGFSRRKPAGRADARRAIRH